MSEVIEAGRKAWREGDRTEARRLAEQALSEAESSGDRSEIIEALRFLAERAHYDGDSALAVQLGTRLVDMIAEEYGPESLKLVPGLNNLSMMYGRAGDLKAQEAALHRSLAVMDSNHVVNDSYGIALYNLAHAVRRSGRSEEYVSLMERCLKVRKAITRTDDPYLADTIYDLGMARLEQERWDEAEELLTSALTMARKFHGSSSWSFKFAHDLAHLYALHDRWTDALPYYEEALATARREGEEYSIYAAQSMSSLGLCLSRLGVGDRAETLLSDALEMLVGLGAPSDRIGETALKLAGELERQGRVEEARRVRADHGVGWPEAVD